MAEVEPDSTNKLQCQDELVIPDSNAADANGEGEEEEEEEETGHEERQPLGEQGPGARAVVESVDAALKELGGYGRHQRRVHLI